MPFSTRNLTNQYISLSFQDVVQRYTPPGTASYFLDGLGNELFVLDTVNAGQKLLTTTSTASYALTSFSASYAVQATVAQVADVALIADTSSLSVSASYSATASVATSASYAPEPVSASYALTTSYALNVVEFPASASWASSSISASYALSASVAQTSSISIFALTAMSSSYEIGRAS